MFCEDHGRDFGFMGVCLLCERNRLLLQISEDKKLIDAAREAWEEERKRFNRLKDELKQALAAMVTHPKLRPNTGDWRISQAQGALLKADGVVTEKRNPECTCTIDGTPHCRARGTGFCLAENPERHHGIPPEEPFSKAVFGD